MEPKKRRRELLLRKRKAEQKNISSLEKEGIVLSQVCFCGVLVPNEVLRVVFSFCVKDEKFIFGIGSTCKTIYFQVLSNFDYLKVSTRNVYEISLVVLGNTRHLTLEHGLLPEDVEYLLSKLNPKKLRKLTFVAHRGWKRSYFFDTEPSFKSISHLLKTLGVKQNETENCFKKVHTVGLSEITVCKIPEQGRWFLRNRSNTEMTESMKKCFPNLRCLLHPYHHSLLTSNLTHLKIRVKVSDETLPFFSVIQNCPLLRVLEVVIIPLTELKFAEDKFKSFFLDGLGYKDLKNRFLESLSISCPTPFARLIISKQEQILHPSSTIRLSWFRLCELDCHFKSREISSNVEKVDSSFPFLSTFLSSVEVVDLQVFETVDLYDHPWTSIRTISEFLTNCSELVLSCSVKKDKESLKTSFEKDMIYLLNSIVLQERESSPKSFDLTFLCGSSGVRRNSENPEIFRFHYDKKGCVLSLFLLDKHSLEDSFRNNDTEGKTLGKEFLEIVIEKLSKTCEKRKDSASISSLGKKIKRIRVFLSSQNLPFKDENEIGSRFRKIECQDLSVEWDFTRKRFGVKWDEAVRRKIFQAGGPSEQMNSTFELKSTLFKIEYELIL